jgi:addiction module HigA family antidote
MYDTEQEPYMPEYIDLDHIGKILHEEFMEPYELSQNALARAIGVAPSRITDIVNGRRAITADTDLRLTRLFGLSEGYFLRIQEHIETTLARRKIGGELARIVPLKRKSA